MDIAEAVLVASQVLVAYQGLADKMANQAFQAFRDLVEIAVCPDLAELAHQALVVKLGHPDFQEFQDFQVLVGLVEFPVGVVL